MASTVGTEQSTLQELAKRHLWLHFTRMSAYRETEVPVIVRGEGCYLEDANGKRYLDALAGLFAVQIGYSYGDEVGEAAAAQMRELPFYTNWSYAHPRAIELAAELADLAPGDLNRVFFVSGGSEAVEGDLPPPGLPRHHLRRALDQRHPGAADAVRAARAGRPPRPQHEPLPPPAGGDRGGVHGLPARRPRADDPGGGAGDRGRRDHGAGAERRRLVHAARGLL